MAPSLRPWFLYLLECRDGSYYAGISTDVDARFAAHQAGKGARYTRARPPLRVLAVREYPDRTGPPPRGPNGSSSSSRANASWPGCRRRILRFCKAEPTLGCCCCCLMVKPSMDPALQ